MITTTITTATAITLIIRTLLIKEIIDNTQENGKCMLSGDRSETVNYISEYSEQAQNEYKDRYN